jgi:hypothetical protein
MRQVLPSIALVFLAACGGGGGGDGGGGGGGGAGGGASGFSQTYTASAAQGELITYSVDTSKLTYSYTVIKSQYGCEVPTSNCHTASGTLTQNADKSFSVSGATESKFYALQSGLLVGTIKLGSMPATPIIGIPNPISSGSSLAGTYNFISVQCPSKSNGAMTGCLGKYGSLTVTSTGTSSIAFSTCESADIENSARVCSTATAGTGTFDSALNAWKFIRTGSTQENYMVAFTSTGGKKVAYIDFNDPGGYGYGQATVSEKQVLTLADRTTNAGNWFMVSLAPGANSSSLVVTANSDGTVSTGGSMLPNQPWNGFIENTVDPRGKFIMAGSGVFTYGGWTDLSGKPKYMIGMKM